MMLRAANLLQEVAAGPSWPALPLLRSWLSQTFELPTEFCCNSESAGHLGPPVFISSSSTTPPASTSLLSISVCQALDEAGVPRKARSALGSDLTSQPFDAATAVTNTPPALLAFPLSSFSLSLQYWAT